MPTVRRKATPEEVAEAGGTDVVRRSATPEEIAEARGEPGQPGHDIYADGPNAHVDTTPITPQGEPLDAVKTWAAEAPLGAGPVIAGAMGAMANAATQFQNDRPTSDLNAYRSVRDDSKREFDSSRNTIWGQAALPLAAISTPLPVKPIPKGAQSTFLGRPISRATAKAVQGGKVGFGAGFTNAMATAPEDLTTMDSDAWNKALRRAFARGSIGAGGGTVMGGLMGAAEPKLRSLAEEQALRAAGLQAGIKNSLKTDLGLNDMDEARALGRRFLDEGLIPPVGSSEAVAKRAERLGDRSGNVISSTMNKADVMTMSAPKPPPGGTSAGRPSNVQQPKPGFDYDAMANASNSVLDDASAPADLLSGGKARDLAEAFRAQAQRTPGSFVGANKAKSDAWKSARFDQDAPMSAQMYRKAVGAARDDIERQVANALGPEDAAALRSANEKFGVAADAQKLAANESQRRAARKGFTMGDVLALTTGGTAGGFTGHPGLGVGGGLAASLGLKAADKYGHATASRFSDWLAKRAAANSGGVTGSAAANALAPYLDLLEEEQKP